MSLAGLENRQREFLATKSLPLPFPLPPLPPSRSYYPNLNFTGLQERDQRTFHTTKYAPLVNHSNFYTIYA
jgi:hypothetical protein